MNHTLDELLLLLDRAIAELPPVSEDETPPPEPE